MRFLLLPWRICEAASRANEQVPRAWLVAAVMSVVHLPMAAWPIIADSIMAVDMQQLQRGCCRQQAYLVAGKLHCVQCVQCQLLCCWSWNCCACCCLAAWLLCWTAAQTAA